MAAHQGEEFELVLGNRQLLSLFFVVVVFFAAFFSVGYFVGFGHGESSGPDPELATAQMPPPAPPPKEEVRLPERLLQPAESKPPEKPAAPSPVETKPSPRATPREVAATPARPKPPAPQPKRRQPAPKAAPKAAPSTPLSQPRPAAPVAATGGSFHLQVAAVRVEPDAQMLAGKLKERGYPAFVAGDNGDGWHRVLVGPFSTRDQATGVKSRLNDDGFDTVLREL